MNPEQVRDVLIDHGVSPSRPRMAILHYLRENLTHPTADEIFRDLRGAVPTLSLTTVYNTLKLFADKGLCLTLTINEKQTCYDGETRPHSHFMCNRCGKVYDIMPEDIPVYLQKETVCGHQVTEIHCYYRGICAECLASCN